MKAVHGAIGVDMEGLRHVPGIWIRDSEGSSFWANVCAQMANRGVTNVPVVCRDGLKGLPEAVEATWPQAMAQTCVVHPVRAANRFVNDHDRKAVCRKLKEVYGAVNEEQARKALDECIASMFVRQVERCFSAVWADGLKNNNKKTSIHKQFDKLGAASDTPCQRTPTTWPTGSPRRSGACGTRTPRAGSTVHGGSRNSSGRC